KAGQPVRFEIIQGPKGLHAVNIQSSLAKIGEPVKSAHAHTPEHAHA
ncbi:hypothetical protein APX70_04885, partial [Pseudomonas syringae pv. maculicola]